MENVQVVEASLRSPTDTSGTGFSKAEVDIEAGSFPPISSSFKKLLSWCKRFRVPLHKSTISKIVPRPSRVRTLEQCPQGYPQLAAFLDSDENFMLYRRFGFLQARMILYKQDELRKLEKELDRMDKIELKKSPELLRSREKADVENPHRTALMSTIETKLNEYAHLLEVGHNLASLKKPPNRDYVSVKSYFDEEDPLCNEESYIYCKEDVITLKPGRENAWLDAFVETAIHKLPSRITRPLFCSPDLRQKVDPKETNIILFSRERIDLVVSLIITIMILALLIVPVYILYHLTRKPIPSNATIAAMLGVLLTCTLVFSGVLSLFTRAKRHEILGSAAAYCAVLVVFMGNVGQFSSTSN